MTDPRAHERLGIEAALSFSLPARGGRSLNTSRPSSTPGAWGCPKTAADEAVVMAVWIRVWQDGSV